MKSVKRHTRMKYPTITLLMLYLFFMSFSCHSVGKLENETSSAEIVENEMWQPLIILTRKDKKMIKAKSKKLYQQKNESALLVGNVEIDFYNDQGEHISILYADSARINERTNDLNANGNVYVVSDSGYTLTTRQITWNQSYKMIVAEDSVLFTTSIGDTLYGVGFESDSDLEEWRIFRPIGISPESL